MITYRTATAFDIPVLVSLERSIFTYDPWSVGQFKEEIAEVGKSRYYLVASDGDEVIGYAGALFISAGMEADILTIAVKEGYRKRGIARAMLAELMKWSLNRGATSMMLEVRKENKEAQSLYEKEGFSKVSERRNYYGMGIDAVVMRKELV